MKRDDHKWFIARVVVHIQSFLLLKSSSVVCGCWHSKGIKLVKKFDYDIFLSGIDSVEMRTLSLKHSNPNPGLKTVPSMEYDAAFQMLSPRDCC